MNMTKKYDDNRLKGDAMLQLKEDHGMTFDQMAERFSMTRSSVAGMVYRAQKRREAKEPKTIKNPSGWGH